MNEGSKSNSNEETRPAVSAAFRGAGEYAVAEYRRTQDWGRVEVDMYRFLKEETDIPPSRAAVGAVIAYAKKIISQNRRADA